MFINDYSSLVRGGILIGNPVSTPNWIAHFSPNLVIDSVIDICYHGCHQLAIDTWLLTVTSRKTQNTIKKYSGELAVGCPTNSGSGLSQRWPVLLPAGYTT